jgi:hypothetical protein
MNRLNHVKLVTPEPELVDAFIREVCDIPAGWRLGESPDKPVRGDDLRPLGPGGELSFDLDVARERGNTAGGGFIAGDPTSRQFQILRSDKAACWAVCISTRNIEGVHERCHARGVPTTPISLADWNERDSIRFFFALVGGLMFEVIRVEPKSSRVSDPASS